jgi:two-component system, NtrC family, sensor kinase
MNKMKSMKSHRPAKLALSPGSTRLKTETAAAADPSVPEPACKIPAARPVVVAGRGQPLEGFLDVTKFKQADGARAFWASLVECSPDAIIGMALDGSVMSWNHGAQELYGYTAEEIVGKPIWLLCPPECANEVLQGLEAAGRNGLVIRYETVRVRKDGMPVDVALTLSPVHDAAGNVTAIATIAHNISERKFREQQMQLQTAALESAPNGVLIANRKGQILWVNPAFTQLTGYAAEEVLDQTPRMLKSGVQDEAFYRNLWSTILRGDTWHGEIVNRRKDGTLYHEEMSITPVRSSDGTIHHFVAVKQDITERKRAQEELLFKTALLETESETTIDGVLVVDPNGRRLQSNRRFAEMFNIPKEVGDQNAMLECVRAQVQDPAAFFERIEYLSSHQSEKGRDEVHFKDGRSIDRYTAPLQGSDGRYFGRVWYFRDITDRKRAEEALRENEQRYRELFENASAIIFTTDLEGRFTSLNRAGQQALGFSQQQAAATDLWHIVAPEYLDVLKQDRDRMAAGEATLVSEIEVTSSDGRRLRLEVKPRMIWQGDKPVGIQAIARDITGRDAAEMELRQAQKLESVGRLAAGIAHEINTPIQFIGDNTRFLEEAFASLKMLLGKYAGLRDAASVSTDLLRDVERAEEQADCRYLLEEIPRAISQTLDGVGRVATIVRAMKEFAHPEKKEMVAADLNMALQSTITVARNEWKYVAEVETEFADLPLVTCNVGDLNQVFLNLLINASHAIGDAAQNGGKGRITVRTACEGDKVHISIADTGSGIPESIRSKIFDPFFTTKEVGRGTGQGLAIAHSVVVDRHKGALSFESEVGQGTTFHIRLPISPGQEKKSR